MVSYWLVAETRLTPFGYIGRHTFLTLNPFLTPNMFPWVIAHYYENLMTCWFNTLHIKPRATSPPHHYQIIELISYANQSIDENENTKFCSVTIDELAPLTNCNLRCPLYLNCFGVVFLFYSLVMTRMTCHIPAMATSNLINGIRDRHRYCEQLVTMGFLRYL